MEFISAIELVYHKLSDQDAQGLRAETNCLLREAKPPKSNINKEESKALRELREDKKNGVNNRQGSGHGDNRQKGVHGKKWKTYWHNWLTGPSM